MNDLVSIIVPVYNVQNYLEKCLISIISQTYGNLEIILVDDGSTDRSGKLCDEYAKQDERIVVFHKENGGLSSARNYGIERAHGSFVAFVDSDDYLNEQCIEMLVDGCEYGSISVCFYEKVSENIQSVPQKNDNVQKEELTVKEAIVRFFNDNTFVSACGKLFPISFFSDISFPEGKIYEDYATIYKLYDKAKKVVLKKATGYYYTIRKNSITSSSFSTKNLDMFSVTDSIESYLDKNIDDSDIREAFYGSKAKCLLYLYYLLSNSTDSDKYSNVKQDVVTYIESKIKIILCSSMVCFKTKVAALMFCVNKKIFISLMKKLYDK